MNESGKLLDRITFNPNQCGGHPCIRGMRIRVKDLMEMLAAGATEQDILRDYTYLEAAAMRFNTSKTLVCAMQKIKRFGCTLSTSVRCSSQKIRTLPSAQHVIPMRHELFGSVWEIQQTRL